MNKVLPPPCVVCIDGNYLFMKPEGFPHDLKIKKKVLTVSFFECEDPNGVKGVTTNYEDEVGIESEEELDNLGAITDALSSVSDALKMVFCNNLLEKMKRVESPSTHDLLMILSITSIMKGIQNKHYV